MLEFDKALVDLGGDFRLTADLGIEKGARVAVMGPSGAGKSTLLGMVSGFLPLAGGRVLWDGRDLGPLAPGARPVSTLFQDQNLFPHLTAAQNVGLGLRPDLRLDRAQKAQVEAALDQVGLAGLGPRKPAALSGGQQSRIALARVLLRARPVLLLDEAFAALGPAMKSEMIALLTRIATETGATVLMVTHDPQDAREFAPQTLLVEHGKALPPQPTGPLLDHPPATLRAYLTRN